MSQFPNLILLSFLMSFHSMSTQAQCNLPENIPSDPALLEAANFDIARCYAPTIYQMAQAGESNSEDGRADLITSVIYDGNFDSGDNWESLENYLTNETIEYDELDPTVYYSVVWTNYAWVITYGYYHPRDYAGTGSCCIDNHENDFEGSILVVSRIDSPQNNVQKFDVVGTASIFHNDLLVYEDDSNIPEVFIDNGTHAVEHNIGGGCIADQINPFCDDCINFGLNQYITYSPVVDGSPYVDTELEQSSHPFDDHDYLVGEGKYVLEDIYGSDSQSLFNLSQSTDPNVSVFNPDGTFVQVGNSECQNGDANAPWNWSQFEYSFEEIMDLVCISFLDPSGICLFDFPWNQFPPTLVVEHNPYDNTCTEYPPSLDVTANLSWPFGSSSFAFERITIHNGATLTIDNSIVLFDQGGQLFIEPGGSLILNNSTLTSCSPSSRWVGVSALNSTSITLNNSHINNAEIGISSGIILSLPNNPPILSISNSSSISNCEIGLFNQYWGSSNTNIDDCTIYDNNIGVFAFSNKGIRITNSTFNQNIVGLRSFNSFVHVLDGNTFENGEIGIETLATYSTSSGLDLGDSGHGQNSFDNLVKGVVCSGGTHPLGVNIKSTDFSNITNIGIQINGSNQVDISENSFQNSLLGISAISAGGYSNEYNCNDFQNITRIGNTFFGRNDGTEFLGNDFTSIGTSNFTLLGAYIVDELGSPSNPAGNCFDNNVPEIFTAPFWNSPGNTFIYNYYNFNPCHYPSYQGNFISVTTNSFPKRCAFKKQVLPRTNPDGDGTPGVRISNFSSSSACKPCIQDSINYWINEILLEGGDDPRTTLDEENNPTQDLYIAQKSFNDWVRFGVYIAIETSDFDYGINLIADFVDWKWKETHFGLLMLKQDFVGAESYLNSINSENQNQDYFVYVQNVGLKVFNGIITGDVTIEESEKDTLIIIANSEYPVRGYARSLYALITGDYLPIIDPPLINPEKPNIDIEQTYATLNDDSFGVYPNPTIDWISFKNYSLIKDIKLFDIQGKLLISRTNNIPRRLDVSNFTNGVYIIQIKDHSNSIYKYRILKN